MVAALRACIKQGERVFGAFGGFQALEVHLHPLEGVPDPRDYTPKP